jgi:hypothetical protein
MKQRSGVQKLDLQIVFELKFNPQIQTMNAKHYKMLPQIYFR